MPPLEFWFFHIAAIAGPRETVALSFVVLSD